MLEGMFTAMNPRLIQFASIVKEGPFSSVSLGAPFIMAGVIVIAFAAMMWVRNQDRSSVIIMIAAILLTLGGLVVDYLWFTPAERVAARLQMLAQALEQGDIEAVMPYVASSADTLREELRSRLGSIDVESVSIKSNLRVVVGNGRPPRTAETRFNAVASVKDQHGSGGSFTIPRFMVVYFVFEDGQWRVLRYEMYDPRGPKTGRFRKPDVLPMVDSRL